MIDHLIRAETKSAWNAYALAEGWTDEDGNPAQGVLIDEIGAVVLVPPVIDVDGNEVTPAVMDDWHHVNLRLLDEPAEELAERASGKAVTTPQEIRAIEVGTEPSRIQFLSSEDITSPIRVWADGMHFRVADETYVEPG